MWSVSNNQILFCRYASRFLRNQRNLGQSSRVHAWNRVGKLKLTEFKAFISVILNMGLIRKSSINEYWNTKFPSQSTPWFRRLFSRNRYQLLLKFLHLVDNRKIAPRNSENYDPTARFKPIVDHLNMTSKRYYTPSQNLSIDESLIGTKARTSMRQYIPTKHSKFGIKFWMLTEAATGYLYHCTVYRGKRYDQTPAGVYHGSHVVQTLMRAANLLNKWYHIFCDSFFTSVSLVKQLLDVRTYLTGTIRSNRKMPMMIKNATLARDESLFARQGDILACAYREREKRKIVRLLSSYHKAGVTDNKPTLISSYNTFMGGVDLNDMLTSFYEDGRKTTKLWKKIAFNLIHRMNINAYVLYKSNTDDNQILSRVQFIQSVIEDLSKPFLESKRRPTIDQDQDLDDRLQRLAQKREKDCDVCSKRTVPGGRRRAKTACRICMKGVHKQCMKKHMKRCRVDE